MKGFGLFKFIRRQRHSSGSAGQESLLTNGSPTSKHFSVRHLSSRFKIAGAFLIAIALGLGFLAIRSTDDTNAQSKAASVDLQVNHSSAALPASTPTNAQPTSTVSNSVSSTSNSVNGSTTNSVTVNGQPVSVPANGSTQKTINSPDGHTSVNISSSQSSTNDNSNSSHSNLNVSTSTTTEDNDSQ